MACWNLARALPSYTCSTSVSRTTTRHHTATEIALIRLANHQSKALHLSPASSQPQRIQIGTSGSMTFANRPATADILWYCQLGKKNRVRLSSTPPAAAVQVPESPATSAWNRHQHSGDHRFRKREIVANPARARCLNLCLVIPPCIPSRYLCWLSPWSRSERQTHHIAPSIPGRKSQKRTHGASRYALTRKQSTQTSSVQFSTDPEFLTVLFKTSQRISQGSKHIQSANVE